ncbi:MAG: CoA ester lyase [Rhizobiaceae bacterium]|nr:CoA ester lyase [Rhizobiaceae bacterium]
MAHSAHKRRRSVLYVPADKERALEKVATLDCDAVIIDLEDAVAPEAKEAGRETMRRFLSEKRPKNCEIIIRINALASEWGTEDLLAARGARPDAILLPKVDGPRDVLEADAALDEMDAPAGLALWAMIETPKALFNLGATAELGRDPAARLACLVAGTNDLIKETGVLATPDRRYLVPWLLQMVAAARAAGIDALDGVMNDFRNADAFESECVEGRNMGFDGKTLIHPTQIEAANRIFMPSASEIAAAEEVVAAFARSENAGKGVVAVGGRMVERLHLAQAERLLVKAGR